MGQLDLLDKTIVLATIDDRGRYGPLNGRSLANKMSAIEKLVEKKKIRIAVVSADQPEKSLPAEPPCQLIRATHFNDLIAKLKKSQYAELSTVEIMWDFILKETDFEMSLEVDCNADKIRELAWIISKADSRISKRTAKSISEKARSHAFNAKYGNWKLEHDERHLGEGGIDLWNDEIEKIFGMLKIKYNSSLLCVGIGSGLEGVGIYDKFRKLYGVDISENAVKKSKIKFPKADILRGEAESLPESIPEVDAYISLKTFQSSFFDINEAIQSCFEVLKPNGVAIISIPKGYYIGGKFYPGLSRTNYDIGLVQKIGTYNVPDKLYPFELIQKIIFQFYRCLFCDIRVFTGIYEHYIFARKRDFILE